jgi:hypothetical protein
MVFKHMVDRQQAQAQVTYKSTPSLKTGQEETIEKTEPLTE